MVPLSDLIKKIREEGGELIISLSNGEEWRIVGESGGGYRVSRSFTDVKDSDLPSVEMRLEDIDKVGGLLGSFPPVLDGVLVRVGGGERLVSVINDFNCYAYIRAVVEKGDCVRNSYWYCFSVEVPGLGRLIYLQHGNLRYLVAVDSSPDYTYGAVYRLVKEFHLDFREETSIEKRG